MLAKSVSSNPKLDQVVGLLVVHLYMRKMAGIMVDMAVAVGYHTRLMIIKEGVPKVSIEAIPSLPTSTLASSHR